MTKARRALVIFLRSEGYAARLAGKSIQSCPQEYMGTMNRYQWEQGWNDANNLEAPTENNG